MYFYEVNKMKTEEAIKLLKTYLLCHGAKEPDECLGKCCDECENDYSRFGDFNEAIETVIEALES